MYETKAHVDEGYLYIRIAGMMDLPEAENVVAAVTAAGKQMRRGFTIISDISEARPTSSDVAEVIKKAQIALFQMGATRVIRIVGQAVAAHLQLARTQREANASYDSYRAASLKDALQLVAQR